MTDIQAPTRASADTAAMLAFEANKKSIGIAYLLWFFLGGLGVHRFYLGRTGSAIGILALTVVGCLTTFLMVGVVLLAVMMVWLLVDAFLIPGIVRQENNALAHTVTR